MECAKSMKEIKLSEKELVSIIAKHFNVNKESIDVQFYITIIGVGTDTTEIKTEAVVTI